MIVSTEKKWVGGKVEKEKKEKNVNKTFTVPG